MYQNKMGRNMKKLILTLVTGILLVFGISACSEGEKLNADVVVFSQKGCPHCEHALAFINGELKNIVPGISVQEYDIRASRHNYELFRHVARLNGLDKNKSLGTPLIVVNRQNVLMGWNPDYQNKLVELLKQKNSNK